jgi:hypothetical protein
MKALRLASSLARTALLLAAACPALSLAAAPRSIDEHRAVDPHAQVEVINVAGRVDVVGWDKPELAVSGTLGGGVERLDITTAGMRTTVRVVTHGLAGIHFGWNPTAPDEARLVVHVPTGASLSTQLVSADLNVSGVGGNQEIQTVSGDVVATVQRDVRVRTVSGDVKLTAGTESRLMEIQTVSGDLTVDGGGGEVGINTVSGDGTLHLGNATRFKVKTVSGDFNVGLALAADGRFDAESISGDLRVDFAGALPPAEYDLQTFSGDLETCTGRKGTREGFGPGNRLNFREGAGTARVRIDTKSGDVRLCTRK